MKNGNSEDDQDSLRGLLREWRPSCALPPNFQADVWRRIELSESGTTFSLGRHLAHWLATWTPRPALVSAYVIAALIIGAAMGWRHARRDEFRITTELGIRYAQAVDPYQSTP